MGDPAFLLLDEPTEGIQPSIIEEMGETLLKLRKTRGLSILLVEQNFDFISDLSDRVLVLERGRITGELSRAELLDQSKVEQFLGFGAARSTRGQATVKSDMPPTKPSSIPNSMHSAASTQSTYLKPVTNMTINRPTPYANARYG